MRNMLNEMRKIVIILCFAFSIVNMSCEYKDFSPKEWAVDQWLEISESGYVASSYEEQYKLSVATNYKIFSAWSDKSWCKTTVDLNSRIVNIFIEPNDGASQRHAIVTVGIQRGNKSLTRDFSVYQVGGAWDVVEGTDFRMRWSQDISDSQKDIIKRQIQQLVFVEGGTFVMGAQYEDSSAPYFDENAYCSSPPHNVTLSDYYIGKYEVTQEQWAAVMTTSPSLFVGGHRPVESITWYEAQDYISRLSSLTGLDFRMPTSAQWEYAARGGRYSMGYSYAGSNNVNDVAHFIPVLTEETSPLYTTIDVGQKRPNELGLYDMNGNVAEMCSDWYGVVSNVDQTDPTGPNKGTSKVARGGCFNDNVSFCSVYSIDMLLYTDNLYTETSFNSMRPFYGLRLVMKKKY